MHTDTRNNRNNINNRHTEQTRVRVSNEQVHGKRYNELNLNFSQTHNCTFCDAQAYVLDK